MRVRRAAKPQTGGIRHQNDCLVETSNFSSLSARGGSAGLGPPRASACGVPVLRGQLPQTGPEQGDPGRALPGHRHARPGNTGVQRTEVPGGKAPGDVSGRALGLLVTMATPEPRRTATGHPGDQRARLRRLRRVPRPARRSPWGSGLSRGPPK